jgi:hemoglobin-like flavoprotein
MPGVSKTPRAARAYGHHMTPEQLELVSSTAAVVLVADSGRFSERFYARLFELDPAVEALFPGDLRAQRQKLVEELRFMVSAAEDLDGFVERTRALGARHHDHGIRPADYDSVGRALLVALADVLGVAWTPEVEAAWRRLYGLISETMLEGSGGSIFADF